MSTLSDPASRRTAYWSYLLGFVVLVAIVSQFQIFWRSNDDVALSLIADGGGQVLTPGPHLVLTNIAWGYFVYGLHLLGDPWAYASSIYIGLALSYLALVYAFLNSKVNHPLVAATMLCVYVPTVISPQHTLVAGYLAFAGIVVLCNSMERRTLMGGAAACALLVLSSLVRWDETAFVVLVAAPLCWSYLTMTWFSPDRNRWLVLAVATCTLGLGLLLLDYITFGLGEWREFADTYGYMMSFTDFKVGRYFDSHPAELAASGFTLNDLQMFTNWFYCDTRVFVPERLAGLLQHVGWLDRIRINLRFSQGVLQPLHDWEIITFLFTAMLFIAAHRHRWRVLGSLAVLVALVFVLTALGRPQVTRVYVPALGAMAVIGVLEVEARTWLRSCLLMAVVLAVNGHYLAIQHKRNLSMQLSSQHVQAATCALPKDALVITWGATYPFILNYRPFASRGTTCYLNNYAFGEYSLAPFALEHLHRYTGGKDFVPALLAGQAFDVLAKRGELLALYQYLQAHYNVALKFERSPISSRFPIYHVQIPTPQGGS